jgi:tripartite-type tricarboxylate transporter receptor subunit TctC
MWQFELFAQAAGIKLTAVPYKGAGAFLADITSGQVDMGMTSSIAAVPYIKSGQMRALLTSGKKRAPTLPDVPTVYELGYKNAVLPGYIGMWFPKGTPKEIVDRMNAAIRKALDTPEMEKVIATAGTEKIWSSPQEFAEFLKDLEFNRKAIQTIGITPK